MKKIAYLSILVALIAGASFFFSCSDSESRMPSAGDATVILNLGLRPDIDTSSASVIDRVLRLFTRDAVAATAPAAISSITVSVTGSDIGTIEKVFPGGDSVSLSVPAGNLRTFVVTAYVANDDPSVVYSYKGITRANLPAGQQVYVPVRMERDQTKILVPDLRNQRLVLLDNISSSGWNSTITTSQVGTITGGFYPFDIDYDSQWRIYIANWVGSGTDIIRMDDLNGTNLKQFNINIAGVFDLTNVTGIAIDRKRDILYCISSTELFKVPLSCIENNTMTGVVRLDNPSNAIWSNLYGIDVDEDGYLYIVNGYTSNWRITKYNPNVATNGIMYQLAFPSLAWGYDIKVAKPFIYILNSGGAANYQILKYHIDSETATSAVYSVVDHFGTSTAVADLSNGQFYGPRRFVGIRNDEFIIIDNYETGYLCKLIGLGIMPSIGSSWSAFGDYGTSTGYFKYYCSC